MDTRIHSDPVRRCLSSSSRRRAPAGRQEYFQPSKGAPVIGKGNRNPGRSNQRTNERTIFLPAIAASIRSIPCPPHLVSLRLEVRIISYRSIDRRRIRRTDLEEESTKTETSTGHAFTVSHCHCLVLLLLQAANTDCGLLFRR